MNENIIKAVAQDLGISPQLLCDILHGRRAPSAELAARLGFQKRIEYEIFEKGRK